MLYTINYNPVLNKWAVWKIYGVHQEIVKMFKTKAAAERWINNRA